VVYAPVETNHGVAMLRFESLATGGPRVDVVADDKLTGRDFEGLLNMSRQPSSAAARTELQNRLLPKDFPSDKNKTVFFQDLFYYGLLPQSFNVEDAITLGSKDIGAALTRWTELQERKMDPKTFTSFMGYPETRPDYQAIFGTTPSAPLSDWQTYASNLRTIANQHGVEVLAARELKNLGTKEKILQRLEEATGIVFIFAHAEGCHLHLSTGELIDLTPSDISKLTLKRSPFVMLRICNGIDNGYANAFLKAGAAGVWANRGPISPETANKQLELFMSFLAKGMTAMEAVRQTQLSNPHARHSTGIFTIIRTRNKNADTKFKSDEE